MDGEDLLPRGRRPYWCSTSSTAFGITHEFHGAGMPRHCNAIHLLQPQNPWAAEHFEAQNDAIAVVRLLEAAFQAGRKDMQRELRELLGIVGTP